VSKEVGRRVVVDVRCASGSQIKSDPPLKQEGAGADIKESLYHRGSTLRKKRLGEGFDFNLKTLTPLGALGVVIDKSDPVGRRQAKGVPKLARGVASHCGKGGVVKGGPW